MSSLLMIVYVPDRRWICRASTSSRGNIPSTRKSLNGCAQDGVVTTVMTIVVAGACPIDPPTSSSTASAMMTSVPKLTTVAPGLQSTAPGATGSTEVEASGTA